jgi:hypothetical protein
MKSMLKMSPCRYALFKDVFTIVLQVNRLPDTPLTITNTDSAPNHDTDLSPLLTVLHTTILIHHHPLYALCSRPQYRFITILITDSTPEHDTDS